KRIVHEIMRFNARQRKGTMRFYKGIYNILIGAQGGAAAFPQRPTFSRGHLLDFIVAGQIAIIGTDKIVTFVHRYGMEKVLPKIGENAVRALLVKPLQILWATQKNATQN